MLRNAFGQLALHPNIRTVTDGGDDGGGDGQQAEPKTFTQDQVNALLAEQKRNERAKFSDYEDLKQAKTRLDELETQNKTDLQKLQERAEKAERELTEGRARLATERVRGALEKALAGRTPDPTALIGLDLSQFIKGEGADPDAIKQWAEQFPEKTASGRPTYSTSFGQGARETVKPAKGERGAAEAARRFGGSQKTTTT